MSQVLCLPCGGMQPASERRGCGLTEWVCLKCGRVAEVDYDDDDEADDELAGLKSEIERLRAIFPAILTALKSGGCTTDVSIEFLEQIPTEVALVLERLREELVAQSELIQHEWASPYELAGLKSEIERLCEKLRIESEEAMSQKARADHLELELVSVEIIASALLSKCGQLRRESEHEVEKAVPKQVR